MSLGKAKKRHAEICEKIAHHDYKYYVLAHPEISDREYDRLFDELRQLETKHPELISVRSPTQRIGAPASDGFKKVKRATRMFSLDNTYDLDTLQDFVQRVRDALPDEQQAVSFVTEPKLDGASIEVIYRDGQLFQASTRGDGQVGEDVTSNAKTIRSLPLRISETAQVILRGEVVIHHADLQAVNKARTAAGDEPFANVRNAAAGSLRLLDPSVAASRPLRVIFYERLEHPTDSHMGMLQWLRDHGLPTHPRELTSLCSDFESIVEYIEGFENKRHDLPYETDGVVIKIESFSQRRLLGHTARFPRWATAYKFAAERARTQVVDVTCDVGRTGTITPVAVLRPVQLSGTQVSRASLHNLDYIAERNMCLGDWVWVEKAGEIIPQVVGVDIEARTDSAKPWTAPTRCPACAQPVHRDDDESALRCINPDCPGILRAAVRYFSSRGAMNIERLGKSLVEQLVAAGLIQDLADIFFLPEKRQALLKLERMGEKSVKRLIAAIEDARHHRDFQQFVTALGIPLVGSVAAYLIAQRYPNLQTLLLADPPKVEETLSGIHGIGPKMATSVARYLASERNRALLEKFIRAGIELRSSFESEAASPQGPLSGKSFCVTGKLSEGRDAIHEKIRAAGGQVHERVKKDTSYLLAGADVGKNKLDSAKKRGTEVIDESALQKMLEVAR